MKSLSKVFLLLATCLLASNAGAHEGHSHAPSEVPAGSPNLQQVGANITQSVQALMATLSRENRAAMMMPLDDRNLERWSWVPVIRGGFAYGDMTPQQVELTNAVMRAAMSSLGYGIAQGIRDIDDLDEAQTPLTRGGPLLDKGAREYRIKVYGTPGSDRWILRFHGHHLVLTIAMNNGVPTSMSPTVFGVLLSLTQGPPKNIENIRTRANQVKQSLTAAQRVRGVSNRPLDDLMSNNRLTVANGRLARLQPLGVMGSDLSPAQQLEVVGIVEEYLSYYQPAIAYQEAQQIYAAGIENIDFLYAGEVEGHSYIRIQGPTFIIEYNTFGGDSHHIHSVYRNLRNDNGALDPLRDHLVQDHGLAQ